eukprot:m.336877 g.336877  ORF g.336877 m.336877 type:complete len:53 (+) comp17987_c0_seq1:357-515(+)
MDGFKAAGILHCESIRCNLTTCSSLLHWQCSSEIEEENKTNNTREQHLSSTK